MSTVVITENNFDSEVGASPLPVLVDFWASWCPPCKSAAPILEQVSKELSGKAKIARININDEPDLAYKFRIRKVPTMLVFRDGHVTDSIVGTLDKSSLVNVLLQQ